MQDGKGGRSVGSGTLLWCVAIFLAVTANFTFFRQTTAVYPVSDNMLFLASLFFVLTSAIAFFASVFSLFLPVRLVAASFLLIGALAGYYADSLGIIIDTEMVRNVLHTDPAEVSDLINTGIIVRTAMLGLVPALIVLFVPLRPMRLMRRQMTFALTAAAALLLTALCVVPFGDTYASYVRQHKPLRYFSNPTYPIYSTIKLALDSMKGAEDRSYQERVASASTPAEDPESELVIAVIGETARADHFSLFGYERETTPRLSARSDLILFGHMKSCGTSTAKSLPCMFSLDDKVDFDIDQADRTENVIDVLVKAGVSVLWRDNNSGTQGVADRVGFENFNDPVNNPVCDDEECRDIGMLAGLDDYIVQQDGDILIVLHQKGSHGPAYFKRYPDDYAKFQPECLSQELGDCSEQEIINTYDNTITYTDHFLNAVIAFLERYQEQYETSMFYLSDHGESLGELGVYLHGMPYAIAPEAQTHVPFIVWASKNSDINVDGLKAMSNEPLTHDAFSRVLLESFEVNADGVAHNEDPEVLTLKSETYGE